MEEKRGLGWDRDMTSPINLCLEHVQDSIAGVILSWMDRACHLLVVSLDSNPEIKRSTYTRWPLCPHMLLCDV